ncbi:multidrug resistance protein 4 [Cristinia sonorae]|uniref:Multidrug resistance protein 4 n=1 Tax=Cristinia sonorae TaxID=1940300 RepID=A0A8K0UHT0_9AGAR|nr:multidrug resistance protein 4 [Cristinia sonorae]
MSENGKTSTYDDTWSVDHRNPRNWSSRKKWAMTLVVSFYTLIPPLASSMMAPALPQIAEHFNITNPTVVALTLSIFLLTFALGPLLFAPLSEIYGRRWVLHIGNILSLAFNTSCGFVPNTGSLIAMRLLAGLVGSAPVAIGGGVISDMFSEQDRSTAMAIYSLGPLLGPSVGPIVAGYVTQTVGFRWIFVIIGGLSAAITLVGLPVLKETYAPVIRAIIARRTGSQESAVTKETNQGLGDGWELIKANITRPFILFTRSSICFLLSLYMGLQYGICYLMLATFPTLYRDVYHFGPGASGLTYTGLGLGFLFSTFLGGPVANRVYTRLSVKNGGVSKPEFRLPILIVASFIVPIGLFWYGWSAQAHLHFMMPIMGSAVLGFGVFGTFIPIQLYLVDTFTYAASALATGAVFRSLFGFAFPLFGEQMLDKLNYGGANSLLAGLAIAIGIPFPIWLYFNGERMRSKSSFTQ